MNLFNKQRPADEAASESTKKKTTKKSVKGLARTVQDILQIDGITNNGIVIYRNQYSKLYHLIDSNFVSEPDDVQAELLKKYTQLVNRFMDNITISVIIINKANTMADMSQAYHIKEKGDSIDEYREAYNAIIDEKISKKKAEIKALETQKQKLLHP